MEDSGVDRRIWAFKMWLQRKHRSDSRAQSEKGKIKKVFFLGMACNSVAVYSFESDLYLARVPLPGSANGLDDSIRGLL